MQIKKVRPIVLPFFILLLATYISQLGSLAFSTYEKQQHFFVVLGPSMLFLSAISIPLILAGLKLGPSMGMGAPLLQDIIYQQGEPWKRLLSDGKFAASIGVLIGLVLLGMRVVLQPYLPDELPVFGHRGVVGGLLVSIGAAIAEEIWFRLGLMTTLIWLICRWRGHKNVPPSIVWFVIAIVSIGFGAIHLFQLSSYGAASSFAIYMTMLGNSLVSIFYAWCYWKRSLLAAIIAHFSVDIVLHLLPAFFI